MDADKQNDFGYDAEVPVTELKLPEKFGTFPRWPEDGEEWIHSDDRELVVGLIPSRRIFHRVRTEDGYSEIRYGELVVRIRPVLWLEVKTDGYLIGDRVEIRSRMGTRRPGIATILEMLWNRELNAVEYKLVAREKPLNDLYRFQDIQPAFRLDQPMTSRQSDLIARARIR